MMLQLASLACFVLILILVLPKSGCPAGQQEADSSQQDTNVTPIRVGETNDTVVNHRIDEPLQPTKSLNELKSLSDIELRLAEIEFKRTQSRYMPRHPSYLLAEENLKTLKEKYE